MKKIINIKPWIINEKNNICINYADMYVTKDTEGFLLRNCSINNAEDIQISFCEFQGKTNIEEAYICNSDLNGEFHIEEKCIIENCLLRFGLETINGEYNKKHLEEHVVFNGKNIYFIHCKIQGSNLGNIENIEFLNCEIKNADLTKFLNCEIKNCVLDNVKIPEHINQDEVRYISQYGYNLEDCIPLIYDATELEEFKFKLSNNENFEPKYKKIHAISEEVAKKYYGNLSDISIEDIKIFEGELVPKGSFSGLDFNLNSCKNCYGYDVEGENPIAWIRNNNNEKELYFIPNDKRYKVYAIEDEDGWCNSKEEEIFIYKKIS